LPSGYTQDDMLYDFTIRQESLLPPTGLACDTWTEHSIARTLYQMTRSLFSSETLTLFWDKTSELTNDLVRTYVLFDSDLQRLRLTFAQHT